MQPKCACKHPDARLCLRGRYPLEDDFDDDDRCECVCHYADEDGFTEWDNEDWRHEEGRHEERSPSQKLQASPPCALSGPVPQKNVPACIPPLRFRVDGGPWEHAHRSMHKNVLMLERSQSVKEFRQRLEDMP